MPSEVRRPADARAGKAGQQRILVGEFGRAHGVTGEVRLKSFTAEPMDIGRYGPLESEDGTRRFVLGKLRRAPGGAADLLVARVEGVGDRIAAEALTRVKLYVPRERLPDDLEEDEYLQADLIGLSVETADGEPIGRIVAFHDFGAGDIMEIEPVGGGKTGMVPFTKACVPLVDMAGGRVVIADRGLLSF